MHHEDKPKFYGNSTGIDKIIDPQTVTKFNLKSALYRKYTKPFIPKASSL